jgi:hypothetical protein
VRAKLSRMFDQWLLEWPASAQVWARKEIDMSAKAPAPTCPRYIRPGTAQNQHPHRPSPDAELSRPYARTQCSGRIASACRWMSQRLTELRLRHRRAANDASSVRSKPIPTASCTVAPPRSGVVRHESAFGSSCPSSRARQSKPPWYSSRASRSDLSSISQA